MKLIMLDQNAISNLAIRPNKIWGEILEVLRYGVQKEKILCPLENFTIAESSHLPKAERKLIENLSDELSKGYCTKFFYDLVAEEILSTVRPGLKTFPLWIPEKSDEIGEEQNLKGAESILKEKTEIEAWFKTLDLPAKDKNLLSKMPNICL